MTITHFSTPRKKFLGVRAKKSVSGTSIRCEGESSKRLEPFGRVKLKSMNDKQLSVVVQSTRGSKTLSFAKTAKISDVISAAVKAFGFAPGDRFELAFATKPGEVLQPERPLVSYHVTDGTAFLLTSIGGGV